MPILRIGESNFLQSAFDSIRCRFWDQPKHAADAVRCLFGKLDLNNRFKMFMHDSKVNEQTFKEKIQPIKDATRELVSHLISQAPAKIWWKNGNEWWFALCRCVKGDRSVDLPVKRAAVIECLKLLRNMPWTPRDSVQNLMLDFTLLKKALKFIFEELAEMAPAEALSFILASDKDHMINRMFDGIGIDEFWSNGTGMFEVLLGIIREIETWSMGDYPRGSLIFTETLDEEKRARAAPLMNTLSALLCRLIQGAPQVPWWQGSYDELRTTTAQDAPSEGPFGADPFPAVSFKRPELKRPSQVAL